jgi:putative transposase
VRRQLGEENVEVGKQRVARLMREMGLQGLPKKRFRHTTDSHHGLAVAPNVVDRNFEAERPNQFWVTDITFIWTWEGWLYLAVILDLFSRRVVGWAMQPHLRAELALEALRVALGRRVPEPGLVHHSDRGIQLGFKGPSQRVRVSLSLSDFEVPLQAFSSRVFFAADC